MSALTFKPKTNGSGYYVLDGERCIGFVVKREGWTTRGAPVFWQAYKKGAPVGHGKTRADAAALLAR